MATVGMANESNRLAGGYLVEIDDRFNGLILTLMRGPGRVDPQTCGREPRMQIER